MSVGFVMMAHANLNRAGQVARHLAEQGAPVVIHVDKSADDRAFYDLVRLTSGQPLIHFAPRIACRWGCWSLVEASRSASAYLLARAPDIRHVYLISGSCLPIRPLRELRAFLDQNPDTDFIESVTTDDVTWTQGGLSEERFTLTFPFSWKRRRRLFDAWVSIQRMLGLRRRVPEDVTPHMGSQWWCLTRKTLQAIAADPDSARLDRYFRRVWIPDESYYATLVRRHARQLESRTLTLSKFDFQGKPHLFFDDHLELLRQSPAFFARKIWPGAQRVYGAFLGDLPLASPARRTSSEIDRTFAAATERRTSGRPGLRMTGRFPRDDFDGPQTAMNYAVFYGFDAVYRSFGDWVQGSLGSIAHGHLFAPDRVEFADDTCVVAGGLTDSARLRDYDPVTFLANLIWSRRDAYQSFLLAARDKHKITPFLACDPNARVSIISGAWALPLMKSGQPAHVIRRKAARLQKKETDLITMLKERRTRASVKVWSLAEVLEAPGEPLRSILETHSVPGTAALTVMPSLQDMQGLTAFLSDLRNIGMDPKTAGPIFSDTHDAHEISTRELG